MYTNREGISILGTKFPISKNKKPVALIITTPSDVIGLVETYHFVTILVA